MIWHPGHVDQSGSRRKNLTQTPDLMPTILEIHNCQVPPSVTGASLKPMLGFDAPVHESLALGMFAGPVCVTDGRYSYFRYPDDLSGENLNLYTLMPTHLSSHFEIDELRTSELVGPFDFTKGAPVLKIRLDPKNTQVGNDGQTLEDCESALYDLENDPGQTTSISDAVIVARLTERITHHFVQHDAPEELFAHFGLVKNRGTHHGHAGSGIEYAK
jgi:hypothetical protein